MWDDEKKRKVNLSDDATLSTIYRLGCMDQYMKSLTLPDLNSATHVLIRDGRACHGGSIVVVWVAEITPNGTHKIVSKLITLPKRSKERPQIFWDAHKQGIELHSVIHEGFPKNRTGGRVTVPDDAGADLLGVTISVDTQNTDDSE